MFKSSHILKLFFAFSLLFSVSCNFGRGGAASGENAAANSNPFISNEFNNTIPFATRESEVYQAEIVSRTTSPASGSDAIERKIFTARNGTKRITIFNSGENGEIARMELNADANFSIY